MTEKQGFFKNKTRFDIKIFFKNKIEMVKK